MKIFYTDNFDFALPEGHSFPFEKYRLLRTRLIESGLVAPDDMRIPHQATEEEILRAHDLKYTRRVLLGEISSQEIKRIGFPRSRALVERARRSCGATVEACRAALGDGLSVSLAGGTHHAFSDRGEGYCLFNDSAIASRAMQAEDLVRRVVIIDCDVHQGNGTAVIFREDSTVFTFSIHGRKNFPFHKEKSDLDIALEDGTDDAIYLSALEQGLGRAIEMAEAELAIYLAGADPFLDDRFGRLSLTKKGLAERDRLVFEYCCAAGVPVAVTMGGGYAKNVEDTVDIHFNTVSTALEILSEEKQRRDHFYEPVRG